MCFYKHEIRQVTSRWFLITIWGEYDKWSISVLKLCGDCFYWIKSILRLTRWILNNHAKFPFYRGSYFLFHDTVWGEGDNLNIRMRARGHEMSAQEVNTTACVTIDEETVVILVSFVSISRIFDHQLHVSTLMDIYHTNYIWNKQVCFYLTTKISFENIYICTINRYHELDTESANAG